MPTVEISRIHTTVKISLFLQTKVTKIAITKCVFWALMRQKCFDGRSSAPYPTGGANSAPSQAL